jgi:hypothetical protein
VWTLEDGIDTPSGTVGKKPTNATQKPKRAIISTTPTISRVHSQNSVPVQKQHAHGFEDVIIHFLLSKAKIFWKL